jgi:hypothetical protein
MTGAAKNHQQRLSAIRADIRNEMTESLSKTSYIYEYILINIYCVETVVGDDTARMEWKHYWRNVVKRYHVIIEGWPDKIPFRNLSDASSPLPDLENLLRKWRNGKTYWKTLTEDEIKVLDLEHDAQIENGELDAPIPRRRRSDYGKK